jgi:hypothetical protein
MRGTAAYTAELFYKRFVELFDKWPGQLNCLISGLDCFISRANTVLKSGFYYRTTPRSQLLN